MKSMTKQSGLTLIELMIALALGLMLSAGALMMFIGNKDTATLQEQYARVQENGRFATDILMREIRPAGFSGCGKDVTITNTLNIGTGIEDFAFSRGVYGYHHNGTNWVVSEDTSNNGTIESGEITTAPSTLTAVSPLAGTDILMIRTVSGGDCRVQKHNGASVSKSSGGSCACSRIKCNGPVAASMEFSGQCGLADGDIVMVSDCIDAALFQLTNVNTTSGTTKVVHNTGSSTTPGNCTKQLGKLYVGGSVMKAQSYIFMIRNNANGDPALYRYNNGTAEELVEGVEDMQFVFGEDTDGDNAVDTYVLANQVLDWDNVISVRLDLMVRSFRDNVLQVNQSLGLDRNNDGDTTDTGETVTNRRVKQVFSTTVVLRNKTS